ncbi:MAG TPA: hypothetical protein VGN00_02555 [Puia sp.]|jgi:hypothetical protein
MSLLAVALAFCSLECYGQKAPRSRGITEKAAIDMVMRLPEVKESNAYIRKHSKDKRPLFAMIYGEPTKEQPYWWVVVGEDNGMSFVTHFGFFVYVKTGRIKYFDTMEGKSSGLETKAKKDGNC